MHLTDEQRNPSLSYFSSIFKNEVTRAFLTGMSERAHIHRRLTELSGHPTIGIPYRRGALYFQTRDSGLQNQDGLVVMDRADGTEEA